ncbi:amidase family protein [Streptomyces sp. NPDC091280]|uniref:amidase family protein n=1 Tax=Streptomyces sp. NPDC091280 TaxID=3365984 RepID=UPI003829A972
MHRLLSQTAAELRQGFADGSVTPLDALQAALDQIDTVNGALNAVVAVDRERAAHAAQEAGRRWEKGSPLSVLDGIPVTVKDSVRAVGMPWRHGAAPNDTLPDCQADSPPAARLREAGAVIVGKTTMPDFGMLASGVSSLYGIVRNPWGLAASPGGSSSGAGASLAAGIGWGAVGSDIAGSVRLPAGHCGLVALKPTQGRIPHLPSSTVRSAGPMARTVGELADLYSVIARPDARDELSLPGEDFDPAADLLAAAGVRGARIAVLLDMGYGHRASDDVTAVVRRAADTLAAAGASVETVAPPFDEDPYPALDTLFQVRARTEWEAFDDAGRARVLPELVAWSQRADHLSATDLERAAHLVGRSRDRITRHLAAYDLVLAPVLPVVAFPAQSVGLDVERPLAHCLYTCWFNQTGQPAAALCFGMAEQMPVGVQVVGPRFADQRVLAVTRYLEAHRGFTPDWPLVPRDAGRTNVPA